MAKDTLTEREQGFNEGLDAAIAYHEQFRAIAQKAADASGPLRNLKNAYRPQNMQMQYLATNTADMITDLQKLRKITEAERAAANQEFG